MITTAEWLAAVAPIETSTPEGKAALLARNAAIFASSTAKPYVMPDYKIVKPPKKIRERAVHPVVMHICPEIGTGVALKALCGLDRGRACKDPTTTTLTIDRYCSNCWRAYAQPRLVA